MSSATAATAIAIDDREFAWIVSFLRTTTGIELKEGKQTLVTGRLERRLRHHELGSYAEYIRLIGDPAQVVERQMAIDLMTTNETFFFREPQHFEMLPGLLPKAPSVRVWSAASSSGEEAYTIALTLAACRPGLGWEVVGTDISSRVLETAQRAMYPLEAAAKIPEHLLREYCLKGRGENAGMLSFTSQIRSRVRFVAANLTRQLPDLGTFDVVFLRNVMIYFSGQTKEDLLQRVAERLRPGGYLLIGHADSVRGLHTTLTPVAPSVFRKSPEPSS